MTEGFLHPVSTGTSVPGGSEQLAYDRIDRFIRLIIQRDRQLQEGLQQPGADRASLLKAAIGKQSLNDNLKQALLSYVDRYVAEHYSTNPDHKATAATPSADQAAVIRVGTSSYSVPATAAETYNNYLAAFAENAEEYLVVLLIKLGLTTPNAVLTERPDLVYLFDNDSTTFIEPLNTWEIGSPLCFKELLGHVCRLRMMARNSDRSNKFPNAVKAFQHLSAPNPTAEVILAATLTQYATLALSEGISSNTLEHGAKGDPRIAGIPIITPDALVHFGVIDEDTCPSADMIGYVKGLRTLYAKVVQATKPTSIRDFAVFPSDELSGLIYHGGREKIR